MRDAHASAVHAHSYQQVPRGRSSLQPVRRLQTACEGAHAGKPYGGSQLLRLPHVVSCCRLYAAPGALGGVLAYVGLNYNKLETWVTEFGTNMKV